MTKCKSGGATSMALRWDPIKWCEITHASHSIVELKYGAVFTQ